MCARGRSPGSNRGGYRVIRGEGVSPTPLAKRGGGKGGGAGDLPCSAATMAGVAGDLPCGAGDNGRRRGRFALRRGQFALRRGDNGRRPGRFALRRRQGRQRPATRAIRLAATYGGEKGVYPGTSMVDPAAMAVDGGNANGEAHVAHAVAGDGPEVYRSTDPEM